LAGRITSGSGVGNAAVVRHILPPISTTGPRHAHARFCHGPHVSKVDTGEGLTRRQREGFHIALGCIATHIGAGLRVRAAVFVRPAILVAIILPVLIPIAGRPTIYPIATFAVLVAIIFIPTLLPIAVNPVIRVGTRCLAITAIGGDADGVGSRGQIVEAIGASGIGPVRGNGDILGILEGHHDIC